MRPKISYGKLRAQGLRRLIYLTSFARGSRDTAFDCQYSSYLLLLRRTATDTCTQHKMRPAVTDVAWSVCLLNTAMSLTKRLNQLRCPWDYPLGWGKELGGALDPQTVVVGYFWGGRTWAYPILPAVDILNFIR